MAKARPSHLDPPVDVLRDHVLGNPEGEITLVEYGSYACTYCHAAHETIADLRDRFGDRMRYVFRHLPIADGGNAQYAAELAEYASAASDKFWPVHDALMKRGPAFSTADFETIAAKFDLPPRDQWPEASRRAAESKVQEDVESARRSGVMITPTFFINGRRYEGPWDANTLAESMQGSLNHRIQAAAVDFVRWGPSAGFLLLFMTIAAVILINSPFGPVFESWWKTSFGFQLGGRTFALSLLDWVNHGLLSVFFLVVGLEIKREFTVGRLANRRAGALPIAASFGGIITPALIYFLLVPSGPLSAGWGIPIGTDTAFAVALIVLLGDRVPVELRVFLTAAVIVDDVVAIAVIALFYSGSIDPTFLAAAVAATGLLIVLNRWGVYGPLPYAALGIALWICLHEAGLHATLAGVIMAIVIPTRPPANLHVLMSQAEAVIQTETKRAGADILRHGPSAPAMHALDVIYGRIESPADKLLRTIEPWSSFFVLPVFALANAGVVWSSQVFEGRGELILAIVLALVIGKPLGIVAAAWAAVRFRLAVKPDEYSWRQLTGAGVLAGIGFTMSLFIAREAFSDEGDFAAAKIAIFLASLIAGICGTLVLWPRRKEQETTTDSVVIDEQASPTGN
jgi:NhaA family Na+:H+ antiporter